MVERWESLSREIMEFPSLVIFEPNWTQPWETCCSDSTLSRGVGLDNLQRSARLNRFVICVNSAAAAAEGVCAPSALWQVPVNRSCLPWTFLCPFARTIRQAELLTWLGNITTGLLPSPLPGRNALGARSFWVGSIFLKSSSIWRSTPGCFLQLVGGRLSLSPWWWRYLQDTQVFYWCGQTEPEKTLLPVLS